MDILVEKLQNIKNNKNTNLKPENLKKGITCLGVEGTLEAGSGSSTSVETDDATATAEDILEGKTAYVNGEKLIGTNKNNAELQVITPNIIKNGSYSHISALLTKIPTITLEDDKIDISNLFYDCVQIKEIVLKNTKNVTNMSNLFYNCRSLISLALGDTTNVTDMSNMFASCTELSTIPQLDTTNVINMQDMFLGCDTLFNDSLNNILAMCTNATKITENKTLKYIGLSDTQINTCKSLSNYSAFTNAGWTTE